MRLPPLVGLRIGVELLGYLGVLIGDTMISEGLAWGRLFGLSVLAHGVLSWLCVLDLEIELMYY